MSWLLREHPCIASRWGLPSAPHFSRSVRQTFDKVTNSQRAASASQLAGSICTLGVGVADPQITHSRDQQIG